MEGKLKLIESIWYVEHKAEPAGDDSYWYNSYPIKVPENTSIKEYLETKFEKLIDDLEGFNVEFEIETHVALLK